MTVHPVHTVSCLNTIYAQTNKNAVACSFFTQSSMGMGMTSLTRDSRASKPYSTSSIFSTLGSADCMSLGRGTITWGVTHAGVEAEAELVGTGFIVCKAFIFLVISVNVRNVYVRIVHNLVVFVVRCYARRLTEWGSSLPDGPHSLTHSVGMTSHIYILTYYHAGSTILSTE